MSLGFSNCRIDITGRGPEDFKKAMSFFFPHKNDTAKAFAVDPKKGMILYWVAPDDHKPASKTSGGADIKSLPYEMKFEAAVQFVWNWLETDEARTIRGHQPDHDGDNAEAWRVYNESWTHVDDRWEALVGIEPLWAMYGK